MKQKTKRIGASLRKYSNENAFSTDLCKHFTNLGYLVQRVETRLTGRGVPDLYVATPQGCYWIELKRDKSKGYCAPGYIVHWRPGQQRWMYQHYRISKVPCFTFVAFDDMVACIPHTQMYKGNWVRYGDILRIWVKLDDIRL